MRRLAQLYQQTPTESVGPAVVVRTTQITRLHFLMYLRAEWFMGPLRCVTKRHTPGSGFSERALVHQGTGGLVAGVVAQDKKGEGGDIDWQGSFSSAVDWAAVGLVLNPADGGPAPAPQIVVSPLSYDYGSTPVGTTSSTYIKIQNTGLGVLVVQDLTMKGSVEFSMASGGNFVLTPGDEYDLRVDFTPEDEGDENGSLVINSNDLTQPAISVTLTGAGLQNSQNGQGRSRANSWWCLS